ncbi:MAG: UbiD family decarboxylase [Candidatus Methanofastidiosia archaeon]
MSLSSYLETFKDEIRIIDKELGIEKLTPYLKTEIPHLFKVKGLKVVGNLWNSRERIARALKIERDDLVRVFEKAIENPVPCEKVSDTPFLQNEITEFDLRELPIPKYFKNDAGQYLTSGVVVAEFEGKRNLSFHRMLVTDRNKFAIRIVPRHLYSMHKKAGELKVAICIGVCPSVFLSAAVSASYDVDELEIASSLREKTLGEKVKEIKIHGLRVPAFAEYIFFGRITQEKAREGPFVDVTGTMDYEREQPVLEVDRIYHKDNPVMHALLPGGHEHHLLMGLPREPVIFKSVSQVVPKVLGVRLTKGSCCWLHGVISIEKQKEGDGKNAAMAAFTGHPSLKKVIVVDHDIDIYNDSEVEWAIATRFQAHKDLILIKGASGSSLDPSADSTTSKIGIDATMPLKDNEKFRRIEE